MLLKHILFVTPSERCWYSRSETTEGLLSLIIITTSQTSVCRSPSCVIVHQSTFTLVTKAAATDHNKSKKQWGNPPTSDPFPYETTLEESQPSDVAHYSSSQPLLPQTLWLHLTVATLWSVADAGGRWGQLLQLDHI